MTKCSIFSFPHQSLDLVFKLAEPIDNSCVICSTIGYSREQSRHFLIWSTKSPITTLVCKVPIWVVNSILILKSLHNILIMLSWLHVFFIDDKKKEKCHILITKMPMWYKNQITYIHFLLSDETNLMDMFLYHHLCMLCLKESKLIF